VTYLSDERLDEILRDAEAGVYNAMRAPTRDEMVDLIDEVLSCRTEHQHGARLMEAEVARLKSLLASSVSTQTGPAIP